MESNNSNNENLINTDIILEKLKVGEINLNNDTNISERNNNIFIQKNNINSNFSNNNNNQFQINNNIQNNKIINNNSVPFFQKNNQMNNNIFNNFNNMNNNNNNFLNNFSNQNNFNNNNFQINNNINQFNNGFNNNANNNNLNQFSNNPHNQISFNNPQIPNNFMNNNNIFNINFAKNNNPIQFNNNLNMNFMQLNQNSNLNNNNNINNNNNFNNFNFPLQNPQNQIINNMFNLPNNNLQNQNNRLELQNRRSNSNKRYFRCQKCNNIMEENLKKDHMFSHQIEENERRRNNYSPNFQINRNHRRVRDNINIRNRPLDRRNIEIRIHTSNNNRNNNNNNAHNRIRREELVYHARPFNEFIPSFLNNNRSNKGKLTFPEIIIEDINKLDDANKSCTICLEEFKSKEKVTALPCFHYFHTNCINKWLEKKKFCPVCKFELTKENLDKKMKNIYH